MRKVKRNVVVRLAAVVFLLFLGFGAGLMAQDHGGLNGQMTNAQTGDPLMFAKFLKK